MQELRAAFEQVPELYDRARPNYPPEVFDDLAELAQPQEAARIVEIGCGTGQATLPLAERGYEITCVELGEQLATVARRKLTRFPNVEVINANFESWQPLRAEFDAAFAFTAFHWIAPEMRYVKTASLLREHGTLAVVSTNHVLSIEGDEFFVEVQEDYEAIVPEDPSYLWDVIYDADEYIGVLSTYSGHRALDDNTRERLLSRIHQRIEARPGSQVRKTYLATLNVSERL